MEREKDLWGNPIPDTAKEDAVEAARAAAERMREAGCGRGPSSPRQEDGTRAPENGDEGVVPVVAEVLESVAIESGSKDCEREMVQAILYLAKQMDRLGGKVEAAALPDAAGREVCPTCAEATEEPPFDGLSDRRKRRGRVFAVVFWVALVVAFAAGAALFVFGGGVGALSAAQV